VRGTKRTSDFDTVHAVTTSDMAQPLVLHYWGMKARGYLPAIVAAVGGVPLEWNKNPDWPAFKPNCPFGQLPTLIGPDGFAVCNLFASCLLVYCGSFFLFPVRELHRFCLTRSLASRLRLCATWRASASCKATRTRNSHSPSSSFRRVRILSYSFLFFSFLLLC
jgi:hypothetical protein